MNVKVMLVNNVLLTVKNKIFTVMGAKNKHEKIKLLNAPIKIFVENLIKSWLSDLFDYVDGKLKDSFERLKS